MKKIMIAVAATFLVAGAASAQYDAGAFWRGAPDSPRERIQFLQERVDRGEADGSLDHHEAKRVQGELNHVRQWVRDTHMEQGTLTPEQRDHVQARLDEISSQIHWMRHNGW